jgi:hypothetical protein
MLDSSVRDDAGLLAWSRAVDLGARGRYLPAWLLAGALGDDQTMASLRHSLLGSHYRQIGIHDRARHHDEQAVALSVDEVARADGVIGLAADAIAMGAADEARGHLHRAHEVLARCDHEPTHARDGDPDLVATEHHLVDSDPEPVDAAGTTVHLLRPWRVRVRYAWVSAEWALLTGDANEAADQARIAIDLSAPRSARHRVKSQAILAAALLAQGATEVAARTCSVAGGHARAHGWASLQWPIALIAMAVEQADPRWKAPGELIGQGAWATRLIEAHLPDDAPGDLAARWRQRVEIADLRDRAGHR